MNFSLNLDATAIAGQLSGQVESLAPPVQQAMAEMFKDIVMSNFGESGLDRPAPWPPLSDRSEIGRAYIRKVGRTYATLYETGLMAGSVNQTNTPAGSSVSLSDQDCPYATRHHEGSELLPRRRVFPILDDGNITEKSKEMVLDAARLALQEAMQ